MFCLCGSVNLTVDIIGPSGGLGLLRLTIIVRGVASQWRCCRLRALFEPRGGQIYESSDPVLEGRIFLQQRSDAGYCQRLRRSWVVDPGLSTRRYVEMFEVQAKPCEVQSLETGLLPLGVQTMVVVMLWVGVQRKRAVGSHSVRT